jgi:hypothetical protein
MKKVILILSLLFVSIGYAQEDYWGYRKIQDSITAVKQAVRAIGNGNGVITQSRFDSLLNTPHSETTVIQSMGTMAIAAGQDQSLAISQADSSIIMNGINKIIYVNGWRDTYSTLTDDPSTNLTTERIYHDFLRVMDGFYNLFISGDMNFYSQSKMMIQSDDDFLFYTTSNMSIQAEGSIDFYHGENLTDSGIPLLKGYKGTATFDDNGGLDTNLAVGQSCNTTMHFSSSDVIVVTPIGQITSNDILSVTAYDTYFVIQRKPNGTPNLTVNWIKVQ